MTSWVDEPDLRVLIVRYEDLQTDPIATFTEVIRFCGLDDDPARIAKAVDFSSFDRVKAQKTTHGYQGTPRRAESFLRKGQSGGWKEALPRHWSPSWLGITKR